MANNDMVKTVKLVVSTLSGVGATTIVSRLVKATKPDRISILGEVGIKLFMPVIFCSAAAETVRIFNAIEKSLEVKIIKPGEDTDGTEEVLEDDE